MNDYDFYVINVNNFGNSSQSTQDESSSNSIHLSEMDLFTKIETFKKSEDFFFEEYEIIK